MPINFTSAISTVFQPAETAPNTETSPKASAPAPANSSTTRLQAPRATPLSQALRQKAMELTSHRRGSSKEEKLKLLATLAVTGEPVVREIARELMRAEGRHKDWKEFEDFERPGFPDAAKTQRQAMALLVHAFGVKTAAELLGAIATTAVRAGSRLQRAAEMAIQSGIVPRHSIVGHSTIGKELESFRISVGF